MCIVLLFLLHVMITSLLFHSNYEIYVCKLPYKSISSEHNHPHPHHRHHPHHYQHQLIIVESGARTPICQGRERKRETIISFNRGDERMLVSTGEMKEC